MARMANQRSFLVIFWQGVALDALTGQLIWRTRIDDHPSATLTGTPALSKGMLYVPVLP